MQEITITGSPNNEIVIIKIIPYVADNKNPQTDNEVANESVKDSNELVKILLKHIPALTCGMVLQKMKEEKS